MNTLEIIGTAVGVVYLILEYRASAWLWVASIAMPAIYLAVYYEAGLYADFGISVYYIVASVYGLVCWLRGSSHAGSADELPITRTPRRIYAPLVAVFATIFALIGYILSRYTDSTVPIADAFTTALSIVAMWMLARKYVEQWLMWIAADVACAVLYVYKDLWFTGALYLAYAVIAVLGYRKWKLLMRSEENG
ncbi:MAG: nicotinamide riboside transporter PnuC [Duncaniella sp.]|nr:nicotinamide riboside transporter PnuC [Duncaniella sp.]